MEKQIAKFLRESSLYADSRVRAETERNRKGLFELILTENGKPISEEAVVTAKLTDIDFRFGANIFMLGQYGDQRDRLYEEKFTKLLNAATVPLYWEGTEPQKGQTRYSADTPDDIYRRPPADKVVSFCEKNRLHMKGHPLFWHEFIPAWTSVMPYSELKKYIVKRFTEISERYAGKIELFDVVNEPSRVYDVYMRDRRGRGAFILPEDDYCMWLFDLARRLFPSNRLILNDTVGASFHEYRGKYSGYYLNIKDLLSRGAGIDEIGFQCHLGDRGGENVYDSERLYNVLDTYASFGKTINISEISIPSVIEGEPDEELQAAAAERLYRVCFSHPAVTGITWWNLTDDGVLTTKRKAGDENLPSTGLIDGGYNEKAAYKTLYRLIHEEWTTNETLRAVGGNACFRGFFGEYELTITIGERKIVRGLRLSKEMSRVRKIDIAKE